MIKDMGDNALPKVVFDVQKNDAEQLALKKRSGNLPSNIEYQRALAYVTAMCEIPRVDFTQGQMERYIRALADIDDYAQAYELSGEATYKEIDDALRSGKCKCKDVTTTILENGRPKTVTHPNAFVKKQVFDLMKQAHVNLMCCNKCLKLYAA